MKQLKKALEAKQAKQAARNKANSKAARVKREGKATQNGGKIAEWKPDMKHVKGLVSAAIKELKHAHTGIRDIIVTWKGERPETLEKMKEEIKAQCKAWLKDEGRRINPQSIYNYQSDLLAACNGYMAYAGMSDAQRKKFDEKHKECTGYHALVKFLRDTKRGKQSARVVPTVEKKMRSAWKNHAKEQMKKAKDMLRYAPTDNLLALIDFAETLVAARKRGGEEGANVRKLLQRAA